MCGRVGHQYNLLGHMGANSSGVVVEPYIITLTTESDTFPTFQHEGLELLHACGSFLPIAAQKV
jgi:hypothetical protein